MKIPFILSEISFTVKGAFRLLLIVFLFLSFEGKAQTLFTISGKVINEKGEALKGSTVFLSGTKHIAVADDQGKFFLSGIEAGTYQLVVKMLGYSPAAQNLIVSGESVNIKVELQPRSFNLKEVVITAPGDWVENYQIFEENFLGFSKSAKRCEILNPKILKFSRDPVRGVLTAYTDEFLIIENRSLGYRIKYLLKDFEYNSNTETTVYDGETSFEELSGTAKQQKKYYENRKIAFYGSLMHFFRAVYGNAVLREGFISNQVYAVESVKEFESMRQFSAEVSKDKQKNKLTIDTRPVEFDTLVSKSDSTLISLRFLNSLYVVYNPKKSLNAELVKQPAVKKKVDFNWNGPCCNCI